MKQAVITKNYVLTGSIVAYVATLGILKVVYGNDATVEATIALWSVLLGFVAGGFLTAGVIVWWKHAEWEKEIQKEVDRQKQALQDSVFQQYRSITSIQMLLEDYILEAIERQHIALNHPQVQRHISSKFNMN